MSDRIEVAGLFHRFSREELKARIESAWDMDGPFPLPRFVPTCPQCGSTETFIRGFSYGVKKGSPEPHRCDVKFKCSVCSMAWTHGVPIPADMQREGPVGWRDARDQIMVPENEQVALHVDESRLRERKWWVLVNGDRVVPRRDALVAVIQHALRQGFTAVGEPIANDHNEYTVVATVTADA